MSRNIKILIGFIITVVIFAGAVVILRLTEPKDDNTDDSTSTTQSKLVYELNADDIESIEISNDSGEYTVIKSGDSYKIKGIEDYKLSSNYISSITGGLSSIIATKVVEENAKDIDRFGIDNPTATATVDFKGTKERTYTVKIGDTAINGDVYFMVDGDSTVYTGQSDQFAALSYDKLQTLDTTMISAEEGAEVNKLSYTTTDGKYLVVFEKKGTGDSAVMEMTSPVSAEVNTTTLDTYINEIKALSAESVLAVDATDEQIEHFGLDKPYFTFSTTIGDKEYTVKVSEATAGYYVCMLNDIKELYKVKTESLELPSKNPQSILRKSLISFDITKSEKLKLTANGVTDNFIFGMNDSNVVTVDYNGKSVDAAYYKDLFIYLMNAPMGEFCTEERKNAEEVAAFAFTQKDGTSFSLRFFTDDEGCYVVENGKPVFTTEKSYIDTLLKNIEAFRRSDEIQQLW